MMTKTQEKKTQMNFEQQTAIDKPINEFVKIVAGAGTGKTQIISKRFYKLVLDIQNTYPQNFLERLLVITFTDKAANEMKERILKELSDNDIKHYGQENAISTIHGFCSKFLRKHSIEVNLSPNFKLADDVEKQKLYQNIIDKIKYNELALINNIQDVCKELNLPLSVLELDNLISLTDVDTIENIFESIFSIIKQVKSLGMTPIEFYQKSNNAINHFASSLKSLQFGFDTKEEYVNSWNEILGKYKDESFIFDNDVLSTLSKSKIVLDKHGARKSNAWTAGEDFVEYIDKTLPLELYSTQVITFIYAIYQKHLENSDLLDFDDLINKTLYILENNKAIKTYYQKFFKHIIVDEFQDTSTAQLRLILNLLSNDAPNLTIVGDRKQSIYGFRYAKMENLDIIQKVIEKKYQKNYQPIQLIKNYRSNQEILDVVNEVTLNELNLDEKLQAGAPPEFVETDKKIKMTNLIDIKNSQDCKIKEGKYIANEILNVKEKNNLKYKDFAILVKNHFQSNVIEEQLNLYGIPVIKKNNQNYFEKDTVMNIISILKFAQNMRNEISLIRILKIKFSQKDILILKYEIDKILYKSEITQNEKELNFADKLIQIFETNKLNELNISDEFKKYLKSVFETTNEIQHTKKDLSVITIYNKLISNIQPFTSKNSLEKQNSLIDLMIFEKIVIDYVKAETYSNLKTLNEYIALIKEDKDFNLPEISNAQIDAVQILTIHASKGLEFPYVFLPIFSNKTKPDANPFSFELKFDNEYDFGIIINKLHGKKTPKKEIYDTIYNNPRLKSEQKRLFYVALSRAKYFLNVISFEKYGKNAPIDYVTNLQDAFTNLKEDINPDNLTVAKRPLPQIKITEPNQQILAPEIEEQSEKITQLSFSKINTFNHCNKLYVLKYIYGYPNLNKDNTGLQLGSIIHNLIADFYVNKKAHSEVLLKTYLQNFELDEIDKQEIRKIYNIFIESEFAKILGRNFLSEYHFDFVYNNVKFSGDVDLLIKNSNGSFDIIDFKTNKNIKNSLLDYNKQLFIYKKAMEHLGYNIQNVYLVNLKSTEFAKFEVLESDLQIAQSALDMDIKNISELNFNNILKSEENCLNCAYKYICS